MKWYWIVLIIVLVLVVAWLLYQQNISSKTAKNDENVVKDNKTTGCNLNMQLAPPPPGKKWSCIDGNWVIVDITGQPDTRIVYVVQRVPFTRYYRRSWHHH